MKKKRSLFVRILRWTGMLIGLIFIVCYLFFRFGMSMNKSDEDIAAVFSKTQSPQYLNATVGEHTIHYAVKGNAKGPLVVLAHGSPGSWDSWLIYFQDTSLTNHVQLLAYDRPGFNKSTPYEPEISLERQAAILGPVLDTLSTGRPVIVVGHSYGGPVAVEMACRFPSKVKAALILAGSISPELEKPYFSFQSWFGKPYLRALLPPPMDVSNREILPLKDELLKQAGCWGRINASVCVLQGSADNLVPAGNEVYAFQMSQGLCGTTLLPGVDHFFIWSQKDIVVRSIFDLIQSLN
ncbi:MAG: alpha/beta fold hydrolase [Bacteroidia bacterium]